MSIAAQESRIPRILETAPDFEARSTQGVIRLSDYTSKGRYVLLFSHPADFTPVCSTEFVAFARAWERFEELNVQLIGVSIDSIYAHIAWVRDLETNAGVQQLRAGMCAGFPAGSDNAHRFVNRSGEDVLLLVVGDRSVGDEVCYPDVDLHAHMGTDGRYRFTHKNGTPY